MVAYDASIEVDKHYMAEALALATRGGGPANSPVGLCQ